MNVLRGAAALLVAIAAGCALYFFCVLPYRCNVIKKAQLRATQFAFAQARTPAGRLVARRNAAAFAPCMNELCRDVSVDLLAAANARVLGRPDDAVQLYLDALRRDVRPEIYVSLAETELTLGKRQAARAHALRATLFNVAMLADIDDGLLRDETTRALIALHPEKKNEIEFFQNYVPPQ